MVSQNITELYRRYSEESPIPLPVIFSATGGSGAGITTYWECPRLFFETHILGLTPVMKAPPLEAGSFIHNFLESYYKQLTFNAATEAAIIALVRERTKDPNIPDALAPHYVNALAEVDPTILMADENRNVPVLMVVCADYATKYPIDQEDFKVHATEFTFAREIAEGVIVAGKIDLIIDWSRGLWVMDHKSTSGVGDGKRLRLSMRPNLQAAIYIWGSRETFATCKGLRFNWIQVTSKTRNYLRDCTTRTAWEIEEMRQNIINTALDVWECCARMTHPRDEVPWTQHWNACALYGECSRHKVCTSSKRDLVRDQDFIPRETITATVN